MVLFKKLFCVYQKQLAETKTIYKLPGIKFNCHAQKENCKPEPIKFDKMSPAILYERQLAANVSGLGDGGIFEKRPTGTAAQ